MENGGDRQGRQDARNTDGWVGGINNLGLGDGREMIAVLMMIKSFWNVMKV